MPRLGQRVNVSRAKKGVPPIVFAVQPTHYFRLDKPEELKEFEQDLQNFFGIDVKNLELRSLAGHACETCSAGCTDDCGLI